MATAKENKAPGAYAGVSPTVPKVRSTPNDSPGRKSSSDLKCDLKGSPDGERQASSIDIMHGLNQLVD
ncbi:hypothetical protein FQN53_000676 [Emmonsiellopsis sp. PD_33]|nr:hypothetical protein FQN53_000676 [Emmonsiellopsis sp. PD_33]